VFIFVPFGGLPRAIPLVVAKQEGPKPIRGLRSGLERAKCLLIAVSVDLVGDQTPDLVVAEVEDIAEGRVYPPASDQRGLDGAFGHDDVAFLDETRDPDVGPGEASFSIASSKTAFPLRLKNGGISHATSWSDTRGSSRGRRP
jgi:hypothetical protein